MEHSTKRGFSFGLTSGIITTLGLIVGLFAGTSSKLAVIGGILTIAIADAFSDALGIHISEEAEGKYSSKQIWKATLSTFAAKFCFALTFVAPFILFSLLVGVIVSIAWGLFGIGVFSYFIARNEGEKPWKVIGEHVLITLVVIIATDLVGRLIASLFA